MNCPYCEGESRVVDSRPSPEGIRRRRECQECRRRFSTVEKVVAAELRVAKAGGRQPEEFSRAKIAKAIMRVSKNTDLSAVRADHIARIIEAAVIDSGRVVVTSREIAEMVLAHLRDVDPKIHERFSVNYEEEGPRRSPHTSAVVQLKLFNGE